MNFCRANQSYKFINLMHIREIYQCYWSFCFCCA